MLDTSLEEHRKVAAYAHSRLFPALDEFASAHDLSISVETGLLILLTQRLVYQGHPPEVVTETVRQAAVSLTSSPKPSPPTPPASQRDNVIPLRG